MKFLLALFQATDTADQRSKVNWTKDQLLQHYSQCMKLSQENKITVSWYSGILLVKFCLCHSGVSPELVAIIGETQGVWRSNRVAVLQPWSEEMHILNVYQCINFFCCSERLQLPSVIHLGEHIFYNHYFHAMRVLVVLLWLHIPVYLLTVELREVWKKKWVAVTAHVSLDLFFFAESFRSFFCWGILVICLTVLQYRNSL